MARGEDELKYSDRCEMGVRFLVSGFRFGRKTAMMDSGIMEKCQSFYYSNVPFFRSRVLD